MNKISFVTSNKNKFLTLSKKLKDVAVRLEHANVNLIEPQTSTIKEIAIFKAQEAFKILQHPVLVHDSGLTITALNDFPGPYTKYVSETIGNIGILDLLKNHSDRSAYLEQTFCYTDSQRTLCFSDSVRGHILNSMQPNIQNTKWGDIWDIFAPGDLNYSRSNLSDEEYFAIRPHIQTNSAWDELYNFLKNLK